MGEIFRGLNFRGVNFSWLKPPTKIGHHENFATLSDSLHDGKMAEKKWLCVRGYQRGYQRGYHAYNDIWEGAVGETLFCVREPRNAHDRYAVTDSLWQNFRGFNFRGLRGPTKISTQRKFLRIRYTPARNVLQSSTNLILSRRYTTYAATVMSPRSPCMRVLERHDSGSVGGSSVCLLGNLFLCTHILTSPQPPSSPSKCQRTSLQCM